jgi:hypothetical protein
MESQGTQRELLDAVVDAAQRRSAAKHDLDEAIVTAREAGVSIPAIREASGYQSNKSIYNILERLK